MAKPTPPKSKRRKKTATKVRQIQLLAAQIKMRLGNWIARLFAPLVEWVRLPRVVRAFINDASQGQDALEKALIEYRLILFKYTYRARQIDAEIWSSYRDCLMDNRRLATQTRRFTLRFYSLRQLRVLHASWLQLLERQATLLKTIHEAPPSFDFYNTMMTSKRSRIVARRHNEELAQRFARAYQMLETAFEYADKYFRENETVLFGNSYLQIKTVRQNWRERLDAFHHMEAEQSDPEVLLEEIERLKDEMFEAPAMTKWIHRIEMDFQRLEHDHNHLVEKHGRAVIADTELNEMRVLIREAIPQSWARGQRQELEQFITTVEKFIMVYQPEIQTELSVFDREDADQQVDTDFLRLMELTRTLIGAIELREPIMVNHSQKVARLSIEIANQMNWDEADIHMLEIAALLHDVGKTWIPETILTKGSDLTEADKTLLRKHPMFGAQILEPFKAFKDISTWIYHHHERWDGTGYPEGLSGVEIPAASRIIAVAEVYDAMISGLGRPTPMTSTQAVRKIKEEAKKAFDPFVVEAFIQAVKVLGL